MNPWILFVVIIVNSNSMTSQQIKVIDQNACITAGDEITRALPQARVHFACLNPGGER